MDCQCDLADGGLLGKKQRDVKGWVLQNGGNQALLALDKQRPEEARGAVVCRALLLGTSACRTEPGQQAFAHSRSRRAGVDGQGKELIQGTRAVGAPAASVCKCVEANWCVAAASTASNWHPDVCMQGLLCKMGACAG